MNENIKKFIVGLADAYGITLTQPRFAAYTKYLTPKLEKTDLNALFEMILYRHNRFPAISDIVNLVEPVSQPRSRAIEILTSIKQAIKLHGDRGGAVEAMGPKAYEFMYKIMCVTPFDFANGNVDLNNPTTFAQWRDSAEQWITGKRAEEQTMMLTAQESSELLDKVNRELPARTPGLEDSAPSFGGVPAKQD